MFPLAAKSASPTTKIFDPVASVISPELAVALNDVSASTSNNSIPDDSTIAIASPINVSLPNWFPALSSVILEVSDSNVAAPETLSAPEPTIPPAESMIAVVAFSATKFVTSFSSTTTDWPVILREPNRLLSPASVMSFTPELSVTKPETFKARSLFWVMLPSDVSVN